MKKLKEQLYKHVEFLSTLSPARNYQNKTSIDKTIGYISRQLEGYGYTVGMQFFDTEEASYTQQNVIARYGDQNKRKLIVGAHYDVCYDTPGADDNSSAVAGMLETARLLMEERPKLNYCVEFVAYANEEPPFFATEDMGSYIHARSLYDSNTEVIGMICYEMIGYFSDEEGSQEIPENMALLKEHSRSIKTISKLPITLLKPTMNKMKIAPDIASFILDNKAHMTDIVNSFDVPDKGNFIIVMGQPKQISFTNKVYKAMGKGSNIDVRKIVLPKEIGLAKMSDHMNYWKHDYNAVMINDTSFLRNPNYHELSDTIDTLNFDKMTEVVKGVYNAVKKF